MPEASLVAAARFLEQYPDDQAAWAALETWADRRFLLVVSKDAFLAAHRRASSRLRRAEELDRADIDLLLPLAWDVRDANHGQPVRATFSLPDS